jgi:uncharacterized protein DUF4402
MNRKPNRTSIVAVSIAWATTIHIAAAQRTASASAHASATIIQGMSITNTASLRFGAMIPGNSGGTSTVTPAGVRTATGSIVLISSSSFPSSSASFALIGAPNLAYTITLPTSLTLNQQGGSNTILLAAFTSSPSQSGSLSSAGTGTVNVGGTVTITSGQAAGIYSGTFTVTLSYQ